MADTPADTKSIEHVFYFTNSGELTLSNHNAIIQTLDRWIGGYFMNASAFTPSAWEGIPIVYQKDGVHPDLIKFAANPEEELKRINGKQVGVNRSPAIDINGHARLTSNFTITDPHVDGLINSKKISLSTGFFGKYDEANKLTATTPNHILLFEEGSGSSAVPVDIGAIILNSTEAKPDVVVEKPQAKITEIDITVIKNSIMKEIEDKMAEETKITEAEKQVQILNSQLEVKAKETAALEARIKEFEADKLVQIKNTRDDQWKQIKNSLAPGLTHEPAKEQELQAKFIGDPFAFSVFLASQIKPVTTQAEGIEHPIVNSGDQDKPGPGAQIGEYDPHQGKFVDKKGA